MGALIKDSWFYLIVFGVIAVAGIIVQAFAPPVGPAAYELESSSYRYS